jgi:hypothetical protein
MTFIFFDHSSTLVSEIKGLQVAFYFSRDVASGEKYEVQKGGEINIIFGQIFRPLETRMTSPAAQDLHDLNIY